MATNQSQRNGDSEPKTGNQSESRARAGASSGAVRRSRNGNESEKKIIETVVEFGRTLPRKVDTQLKRNPTATLATIGGVSFALGALLGSKFGRMALVAAVPFIVKRMFEGDFGRELGDYARGLVDDAVSPVS